MWWKTKYVQHLPFVQRHEWCPQGLFSSTFLLSRHGSVHGFFCLAMDFRVHPCSANAATSEESVDGTADFFGPSNKVQHKCTVFCCNFHIERKASARPTRGGRKMIRFFQSQGRGHTSVIGMWFTRLHLSFPESLCSVWGGRKWYCAGTCLRAFRNGASPSWPGRHNRTKPITRSGFF